MAAVSFPWPLRFQFAFLPRPRTRRHLYESASAKLPERSRDTKARD